MADHGFVRAHRNIRNAIADDGLERKIFHLVVLGRAGSVGVDVIDGVRRQASVVDGIADRADDR